MKFVYRLMQNKSVFLKAAVIPFWVLLMLVLFHSECLNTILILFFFLSSPAHQSLQ